MSAARDTEETVSSGSETKPAGKVESGVDPRDGNEARGNPPKPSHPGGETQPSGAAKADDSGAAAHSTPAEPPKPGADKAGADGEPSLGKILSGAREQRGFSRDAVVAETRIPGHYIDMIERSDYGLISDQLYLMPFVRRYAAFLGLDGEEVAMRFVREVQRAEGAAVPRMSEPLTLHDRRRAPWGRMALVIVVLSAIVVLYVIVSERHSGEFGLHHAVPASEPASPANAISPAAEAPAPPAAGPPAVAPAPVQAPMMAPAPTTVSPPRPAASAQMPQTSVVGAPGAPGTSGLTPKNTPPGRGTAPSHSTEE